MQWIDFVWPMTGAMSLTLGLIHFSIWTQQRTQWDQLAFGGAAIVVAVLAIVELLGMRATTPHGYLMLMRWAHVPYAAMIILLVVFVHFRFHASRTWLALTACGLRVCALGLNFIAGANLNFSSVDALAQIHLWGGATIVIPVGQPNPWMLVGQISHLAFAAYLIDVIVSVWRRGQAGERRRVLLVCGSVLVFVFAQNTWLLLLVLKIIQAPIIVNTAFVCVIGVLSYELGGDVLRAASLSRELAASKSSLLDSEMRFRLVVENAPRAILMLDVSGYIRLANARAGHLFGYPQADLCGLQINTLVPGLIQEAPSTGITPQSAVPDNRVSGAGHRLEARHVSGRIVSVEAAISPLHIASDIFSIVTITDISERQRMEQQISDQRDEIAHLSRISLLGELAGSLAHELNQPLTVILSNAQAAQSFLEHDPPDLDEVDECLDLVVKGSRQANEVILRMRAMMRKDLHKPRRIDMNDVVRDTIRLLGTNLLNRRVIAVQNLEHDLPPIEADPVQLKQILMNLAINACDAMAEQADGRLLTFTTRGRSGTAIEIAISDTGTGIPVDDMKRILTPFVTSKPGGLGLGLPICVTLVEVHGGELWATNNESGGATFHVLLPAAGMSLHRST